MYNLGTTQDQAARIAFKPSYDKLAKDMRNDVSNRLDVRGFGPGKDGLDLPAVKVRLTPLDAAGAAAALDL